MKLPNIETCQFVPITGLKCFFAKGQFEQFLKRLADDNSITWGDSNRTMISVERFKDAIESATFPNPWNGIKHINDLQEYLDELELKSVYIDFEN